MVNIPLDNNYQNTLYFANWSTQDDYFRRAEGTVFTEQYYTRPYRGAIRVEIPAETAYCYNYMRFQNTAYGGKWFYAFITNYKWINNQVTEFTFEIDVLQTWYFDYQLEQCFVVREHSATDEIGDNLVPETLETGEYMINTDYNSDTIFNNSSYAIVVLSTLDYEGNQARYGYTVAGMYNGLNYLVFKDDLTETAAHKVNAYINTIIASPDAIQAIFMVPEFFTTFEELVDPGHYIPKVKEWIFNKSFLWTYTRNGKTGPRNKKLYTHPYNTLVVTNQDGKSSVMPYEFFHTPNDLEHSDSQCCFDIIGIASPIPQCVLIPKWYKMDTNYVNDVRNYNEKMVLDNFPQCAYATDTFRAWMAQNKYTLQISTISAGANTAIDTISDFMSTGAQIEGAIAKGDSLVKSTGMTGEMQSQYDVATFGARNAKRFLNYATQVAQMCNQIYQHSLVPPATHGSGSNALGLATNTIGFRAFNMRVMDEFAAIIDDYFDRYGYATHKLKVPNTHVRKRWTFTKTIGCQIKPANATTGVPNDDVDKIEAIYNNGITFWVYPSDVGNFSLDNPVLT